MDYYMYIALQDDNKVSVFTMDAENGELTPQTEATVPGGPSLLAISPDRKVLYIGHRTVPEISSHLIDQTTGGLTKTGTVSPADPPAFLATDRRGKYLLSSHYQGGHAAVHPINYNGAVGGPPVEWLATDDGAHAMQTDRSNKFAFVPHIARLNDNVLEPAKDAPGPNVIFQFNFDENTGRLTANASPRVEQEDLIGPRHYCFHPTQDIVYFSNEQGCSVTGNLSYRQRLDTSTGTQGCSVTGYRFRRERFRRSKLLQRFPMVTPKGTLAPRFRSRLPADSCMFPTGATTVSRASPSTSPTAG